MFKPVNISLPKNNWDTDISTNINSYMHFGDLTDLTQSHSKANPNSNLNPNAKVFVPKKLNAVALPYDNIILNNAEELNLKNTNRLFLNPLAEVFFPNYLRKTNLPAPDTLITNSINRSPIALNCCTIVDNTSAPKVTDYESTCLSLDIDNNANLSTITLNTPEVSNSSNFNTNDTLMETLSLNSSMTTPYLDESDNDDPVQKNDLSILKNIRISNINRLVIGQLNINSIRNKFQTLKATMSGNLDILVITESKIDESFPIAQFIMEGYSPPFRLDRNANGGGVLIYVRDDIACRELKNHPNITTIEGIYLELNLKRSKWLVFGGYNPSKDNIANFVKELGTTLDHYMPKYDNFLLLGDFNSEITENTMKEFSDIYNLSSLIKEHTCFKNPLNPSTIDLILTNRPRSFQNSQAIELGLSDHHKLTITIMKAFFPKQAPIIISYRDYKHYDMNNFRNELLQGLHNIHGSISYDIFENVCITILNRHAPLKNKYIRANNSPFMNKTLSKAVMTRSRLKNKFIKNPNEMNKVNYTKYRNYCTGLFRKEKKSYYNNLNIRSLNDHKKFWKLVKPLFSEKHFCSSKIILVEDGEIISGDIDVARKFNNYFSNVVKDLNIEGYEIDYSFNYELDDVSNIIEKFKKHPSIQKIKENVKIQAKFNFENINTLVVEEHISSLDKRKPTTFKNIPTKILVENYNIFSPFITNLFNDSKNNSEFPSALKLADITPTHKKDERTTKSNYRPVSILHPISKIFERNMHDQIYLYIDKFLSPFLFGFRKGYSTQYCLMVMINKWNQAIDKGNFAGSLLTDLSKAFDCLNHELLIAKLEAYGFDNESLAYVYSYLSNRKQRTKINTSLSEWADITTGVPQGSILGPLLFNIYINDIFYFVNKCDLANYADDTTPYTTDTSIDSLLQCLYEDTSILLKWFKDNHLQMNPDKCKLLISNKSKDISLILENETIECSNSVKLLGITIDNKLDFNEHVCKLCKKVSSKLHALARISNFMSNDKLRLLMKSFIESQFDYCPIIWMFHSRSLNNRINRLHERTLRLVYKDSNLSFEYILRKDKSFTIHHRNLQKLAIEMYKTYKDLTPSLIKSIFPKRNIPYNLRNKNDFHSSNIRTVFNGMETISFRGPKIWGLVPDEIKNSKSLTEFKAKIWNWEPVGCTCRLCRTHIHNLGFL